ncbi:hypothetical protein LTR16_001022 [Cryomyces antarcticus]|uniref:Histone chaperone domain-containing protein n=1 Tax=Cryomyces antarcticus TaxID=329879 RepID=A0ABR0LQK5_9PEZI|nr:hypothetical protein LTR16_001022 [Cryomyces antarcticus]
MSVILDEPPPSKTKKRQTKSPPDKPSKAKASKATKAAAKAKAGPEDPEEAEIKRLQGWLIKCGIRKLWHKELAAYDTPKTKISHLKRMLKDAGMDGRYSVEKASRIKEQRELAADLEAVQAGAKLWGHDEDGEENENGGGGSGEKQPKRRLAKGFKELDFLGSDGDDSILPDAPAVPLDADSESSSESQDVDVDVTPKATHAQAALPSSTRLEDMFEDDDDDEFSSSAAPTRADSSQEAM